MLTVGVRAKLALGTGAAMVLMLVRLNAPSPSLLTSSADPRVSLRAGGPVAALAKTWPAPSEGGAASPMAPEAVDQEVERYRASQEERLPGRLPWFFSLREAQSLSVQTGRPLAIFRCEGDYRTGRVCNPSVWVRAQLLSNPSVLRELAQHYILVQPGMEPEEKALFRLMVRLGFLRSAVNHLGSWWRGPRFFPVIALVGAGIEPSVVMAAPVSQMPDAEAFARTLANFAQQVHGANQGTVGFQALPTQGCNVKVTSRFLPSATLGVTYGFRLPQEPVQARKRDLTNLDSASLYPLRVAVPYYEERGLPAGFLARLTSPLQSQVPRPGQSWSVPAELSAELFVPLSPPTHDSFPAQKDVEQCALMASRVEGMRDEIQLRLTGSLRLRRPWFPEAREHYSLEGIPLFEGRDDHWAQAQVSGYVRYVEGHPETLRFALTTRQGVYTGTDGTRLPWVGVMTTQDASTSRVLPH